MSSAVFGVGVRKLFEHNVVDSNSLTRTLVLRCMIRCQVVHASLIWVLLIENLVRKHTLWRQHCAQVLPSHRGSAWLAGRFGASSCSRSRTASIHTWPSNRTWALYKSVMARGVNDVEECSATAEMRTEGPLCMVSTWLVQVVTLVTFSSEDVAACEALVAKFWKVQPSCTLGRRVRMLSEWQDGLGCHQVLGEDGRGCRSLVAVVVLLFGNVATCSDTCTWLRVTSLSRRLGDGFRDMGSFRVDDIKALDLPGPSRRTTQEFAVWGAVTEKRSRTVGTFMKAQDESENNLTTCIKQAMGTYHVA